VGVDVTVIFGQWCGSVIGGPRRELQVVGKQTFRICGVEMW
jgi:hypothetical protein